METSTSSIEKTLVSLALAPFAFLCFFLLFCVVFVFAFLFLFSSREIDQSWLPPSGCAWPVWEVSAVTETHLSFIFF